MFNMEKREKETEEVTAPVAAPEPSMLKCVLGDRIVFASADLVVEISEGNTSNFRAGKANIGIAFGKINEERMARKLSKTLKESKVGKAIADHRAALIESNREEIMSKLKASGVDKAAVEEINSLLEDGDIDFLIK